MSLEIEHQRRQNGNYVVGISTKYQYSYGRGRGHGVAADFLSLIFMPKSKLLAVLGHDDAVGGPVRAGLRPAVSGSTGAENTGQREV